MNQPIVIVGAGGHALSLVDLLQILDRPILGFADKSPDCRVSRDGGEGWIVHDDDWVLSLPRESVELVNGVGSVRRTTQRQRIYQNFRKQGFRFATIVDPTARISPRARLGAGCQVLFGALVHAAAEIGENVLLNSRAIVDHESRIGSHSHIAPGAILSGDVILGEGVHVGCGATIIQGVRVGNGAIIGAGAVVIEDVPENVTVHGVPARPGGTGDRPA